MATFSFHERLWDALTKVPPEVLRNHKLAQQFSRTLSHADLCSQIMQRYSMSNKDPVAVGFVREYAFVPMAGIEDTHAREVLWTPGPAPPIMFTR